MGMRGSSLPRSLGSATPTYGPKKPADFKRQGSISNLLSFSDPPPAPVIQHKKAESVPYNPYAPKKPVDDSVIDYNGSQHSQNRDIQQNFQTLPIKHQQPTSMYQQPNNNDFERKRQEELDRKYQEKLRQEAALERERLQAQENQRRQEEMERQGRKGGN